MKLHHIFYFFSSPLQKVLFFAVVLAPLFCPPVGTCLPLPPLSPPILKVTGVGSLVGIFHIFLPGLVITYKHKYSLRECLGFGLKFFCTLLFLLSSSSRKPFSVHLPQLRAASKAVNWTHHCLCSHSLTDKHSLCFQVFFFCHRRQCLDIQFYLLVPLFQEARAPEGGLLGEGGVCFH